MAIDAAWYQRYLAAFVACARGDGDTDTLLGHYGVPLIITSDAAILTLHTEYETGAAIENELDALRAIGYDHSTVIQLQLTTLNRTSTLVRSTLSRRDRSGGELSRPTMTYVVTDNGTRPRISVLAAHSS
ncbi:hypothetical protein FZI85_05810 [Mycobacterium sp. CBMA293]|uniref:DUF6841 family protein n=1 Tax=unclassified Mycolicibacterium TaxID=2636767 RepID=UPI0012DE205F|nr:MULTISPECIES: hypothetical protein [unclassified Mycolicibacterium]MUL48795.1 hypothetical protein [Mycolicibacterium sp. CBMA 360]MUL62250.1 hypothetical protein [Mycolicibacterium sp. CBMA 335]MUL71710.1 hypothetical protein [Mycolicibacterium sp. CBMA 311]MUL93665.1 hypothetical protein [Mycolicibacterium sp. CBMA 230]MUM09350.1 hypothetical protein [Mycolicibacterium sp. CBMA 213]